MPENGSYKDLIGQTVKYVLEGRERQRGKGGVFVGVFLRGKDRSFALDVRKRLYESLNT